MILFLLLIILIILLILIKNGNENFSDEYIPDFLSVYNSRLAKYQNTEIKILLIGSISQSKLNFINDYFKNCIIYLYNEEITYYNNLPSNINQNENSPFGIDQITNLHNNHVNFDIIITCGQTELRNLEFIAKSYINLLNKTGIIIFENVQSIIDANSIIKSIPIQFNYEIDIIDLRRKLPSKTDKICVILDKSL